MDAVDSLFPLLTQSYRSERVKHDDTFLERLNEIGSDSSLGEIFHEQTKYTTPMSDREVRSATQFDSPELSYAETRIDPDYATSRTVQLPEPELPSGVTLSEVLRSRRSRRSFGGDALSLETIANLLGGACGSSLRGRVTIEEFGTQTERVLRRYPSGGALYPVEIYPIVLESTDLPHTVGYYNVNSHSIRVLEERDERLAEEVASCFAGDHIAVRDSALVVACTSTFPRVRAKYGPRGYRYALQESGHVVQNLQLVSEALGLASVAAGGFDDYRFDDLLGVDGVNETVVYTVVIGTREGNDV